MQADRNVEQIGTKLPVHDASTPATMPAKRKNAKGKEQPNLGTFNFKLKYPLHACLRCAGQGDGLLHRLCPCLLRRTIDLVASGVISLGVQKLAHVHTLGTTKNGETQGLSKRGPSTGHTSITLSKLTRTQANIGR